MSSFSQRHGYNEPPEVNSESRCTAPSALRFLVGSSAKRWDIGKRVLRNLTWRIVNVDLGTDEKHLWPAFHSALLDAPWFQIYEVIEALYATFKEDDDDIGFVDLDTPFPRAPGFELDINQYLIQEGIPWQLVDGEIVTRGDETFEATVKTAVAVLDDDEKPTAAGHLRFALTALSTRPKANTSGAVAHATSAVECVVGEVAGKRMTLGKYLDKYPGLFHPALKRGLDGIYGYASDEGARHGKEGTEPTTEDAEFAVAVCAAVCTLLTRKHGGHH